MAARARIRLLAGLLTVVLAGRAAADDCEAVASLTRTMAAAEDAVGASRDALDGGADVVAPLADAEAALRAADADVVASTATSLAGKLRRSIRARLWAATRAIVRAESRPTRSRAVRRFLAKAARNVARAESLVARVTASLGCGLTLNGPVAAAEVFPADNWWNEDVSLRQPTAGSDATIDFIGRDTPFHADFGTTFGIPYVVLDAAQPLSAVTFGYADESDAGAPGQPPGYPIPPAARTTAGFVEGGVAGGGTSGDRHLILVDRTTHHLFELYATRWTGSAWTAGSGAIFDLTSNARRPEGWTSADAAGLAIFPGLVRADEVFDVGEIRHALRFTVRATQGYVYPASHDATHGAGGASRPPLGLRVRMKASVDLTGLSAPAQVIFTAMKRYGLVLADNGSDWYVTGAPDPRWDDERMHDDFARITGDDFEVVP